MCGRFVFAAELFDVVRQFAIVEKKHSVPASYNIAPTQKINVIAQWDQHRYLDTARWGLIPHYAKDDKGPVLLNTRQETIKSKGAFKELFLQQRCIIPASGFYEWKQVGKQKVPYFIHCAKNPILGFGGIASMWAGHEQEMMLTCSIITTEPTPFMAKIHDRMPVILCPEHYGAWLDLRTPITDLYEMLKPSPAPLEAYKVSALVNDVKNNKRSLIDRV